LYYSTIAISKSTGKCYFFLFHVVSYCFLAIYNVISNQSQYNVVDIFLAGVAKVEKDIIYRTANFLCEHIRLRLGLRYMYAFTLILGFNH